MEQQQQTTISLELPVDKDALYFIDWDKVKDVNDLLLIIASLGISFSPMHPAWGQIQHLADLNRPIKPNQPQPKQEEIRLPKLQKITKK